MGHPISNSEISNNETESVINVTVLCKKQGDQSDSVEICECLFDMLGSVKLFYVFFFVVLKKEFEIKSKPRCDMREFFYYVIFKCLTCQNNNRIFDRVPYSMYTVKKEHKNIKPKSGIHKLFF